jgi:prophage regulatory protein
MQQHHQHQAKPTKILRMKQVTAMVGLGRSSIHNKRNPASPLYDPTWPTPIRLSANAVGYYEHALESWLASREEVRAG